MRCSHLNRALALFGDKMSFTENDMKRQMVLLQEIESQSDRGTAIVGAAWVEEELKAALKANLLDDEVVYKRLFQNGRLSDFSSCIDLSYMLKLVDKSQYQDLEKIRRIRNEFAHKLTDKNLEELSFNNASISDRCMQLSCIQNEKITDPRHAFCRACAILYSEFYFLTIVPKIRYQP